MMRRQFLHALVAISMSAWCLSAEATPVSYTFTGTFDQQTTGSGIFPSVLNGQSFQGTYTYDNTWIDAVPGNPNFGAYLGTGSPYQMTVSFAGTTVFGNGAAIQFTNDQPNGPGFVDAYGVTFSMNGGMPGAAATLNGTPIFVNLLRFFLTDLLRRP
jgi:hypothetical protein